MIESTIKPKPPAPRPREESQARFIKILESTTDLVLMADREGRTLYVNKAGRDMLGWTTEEATERIPMADIFPAWAFAIMSERAMPAAYSGGSWSGEMAVLTRSGREIPVLQVLLAHSGADGEVDFYSTICRDISERKHKELEQIEWSNRYDAAIRASGQVLFDWDSTSGKISYGGAPERLTGFLAEELGGGLAQLRAMINAGDQEAFDKAIQRAIETREALRIEFRLKRKDGREVVVRAQGHFFLDRLGRIGRMVGFLSDITAEKIYERGVALTHERLEQSVAERTHALESANSRLLERARQQETVARLGQRALMGISLPELMALAVEVIRTALLVECVSINEWMPEAKVFTARAHCGWPMGQSNNQTQGEKLSQSGYTMGVGHPVLSSNYNTESRFTPSEACRLTGIQSALTAPIQAGERPFGVVGAFSTKRRAFEQEDISFLQGVANILSAAIERLRVEDAARRAQSDAEAANRGKSEFLSRMSHELRTPLNAILGFTQLLELEEHNASQAESIDHISKAGRNLLELINEVLDIARLDSGRIEFNFEPVELALFLEEIVSCMKPTASRQQVNLHIAEIPADAIATTDPERLRQVLLNLIANAVKFNRPEGIVTIAVAPSGTDYWKISIIDTGLGISEADLSRLFVPFERLGQKEGGVAGGTGLGLALCQRLVKGLDGRITVSSTEGLGSTFAVEIPALVSIHQPKLPDTPTPVSQPMPTQKTILYIEDDLANFRLLERIVETRGNLKLISAIDGSVALGLAKEHLPALILLDLNLPDATGEDILEQLKADPATQAIPVIVVTGEVGGGRAEDMLDQGAVEVLAKPYRISDFFGMLDKHLGA